MRKSRERFRITLIHPIRGFQSLKTGVFNDIYRIKPLLSKKNNELPTFRSSLYAKNAELELLVSARHQNVSSDDAFPSVVRFSYKYVQWKAERSQ